MNKTVVLAIELGTTFSGYACSFKIEHMSNPLAITIYNWSAEERIRHSEIKVPSLMLLNPDQSFNCFGYQAQHTYSDLLDNDPEKAAEYYFVENFKMQLFNRVCM